MKPHDKIFDEIRRFVKAKFTELEALEIPSEYFEETVDEIEHNLYTLGEEIDYWAENRKADPAWEAIGLVRREAAPTRIELPPDPDVLNRLFEVPSNEQLDKELASAMAESKKLAEDKWLKTYQEVLKNVDSDTE